MATLKEQNAAFDAANKQLHIELANHDFFMKSLVVAKFESPEGRQLLLNVVRTALEAAEKARA